MTTRPSRRTTTVSAAAAALLLALTGCSSPSGEAAPLPRPSDTPSTTTTTTSPTASPSPTAQVPAATPEEQAIEGAQAAVRRYYAVLNTLSSDPTVDVDRVKEVTIGARMGEAFDEVNLQRSKGRRQVGTTEVVDMPAEVVSLEFAPAQQPPRIPVVLVAACYDVTNVDVVDSAGQSVVTAQRKDRALERLRLVNYSWPDAAGWRVSSSEVKNEPCVSNVA